jgi:hypothetical protein
MFRKLGLASVLLASLAFLVLGCHASRRAGHPESLSEAQALELAVALANGESKAKFSVEPFDGSSYEINFIDGRWRWGKFDPSGFYGFSTLVSFDGQGRDRRVVVFFSWDSAIRTP